MLLKNKTTVTLSNGPRPFGRPDRCFYCGEPLGAEHKDDCVLRLKVVMVEVTMTIPRLVPASWGAENVDFQMNDSSWCANNVGDDLLRYLAASGEDAQCMCGTFEARFLRDATDSDLHGVDLVLLSADQ